MSDPVPGSPVPGSPAAGAGRQCVVQRGFFNMRICGAPAVAACASCGRPICAEHSLAGPSGTLCLDCNARIREEQQQPWDDTGDAWTYRYRRRHHGAFSGRFSTYNDPFWYGYYDRGDYYGWHHQGLDPDDHDEDRDGGFFDS